MKLRIHVRLDPSLVDEVDDLAGPGHRSVFISDAIRSRLKLRRETRSAEPDDLWAPERALWLRNLR